MVENGSQLQHFSKTTDIARKLVSFHYNGHCVELVHTLFIAGLDQ